MHQPHPTVNVRAPKREHHGHSFLRLRKSQLTFGAVAFTAMLAYLPAIPASAEVVQPQTEKVVNLQSFVTPLTVAAPRDVARPDYAVTLLSMVQAPVPAGTRVMSPFGYRGSSCAGCSDFHSGVDLAVGDGSPVTSIADGVVSQVGPDASLGTFVKVEHTIDGKTVTSTYAHMRAGSMPFAVGDVVSRGTQLGLVGMTGVATAPHLHFEIRVGGPFDAPISPLGWLTANVNA